MAESGDSVSVRTPPRAGHPTSAQTRFARADPSALRADLESQLRASARTLPLGRLVAAEVIAPATVLAGGIYLWWRLSTLEGTGVLGGIFLAAEAANFLLFAVAVVLFLRLDRTREPPARPSGSLDVYITVCGEPVEMVERTLRAALAIDYPHATSILNDGYLAGKQEAQAAEALAERYGVACFSRRDGAPGKAGNLNHALARTSGEFVLVLDADHEVGADAADELLGYFADPRVAFVLTPQLFDPSDPALNNAEEHFYGVVQTAKDRDGCAFSCGNGVVYRRAALGELGGFSEWNLVEDLHTSYELHARGWRSVYHRRPVSVGQAPATAASYAKQRLTWATDGLRLLLWDSPVTKRGLGWRARIHYLHTACFYPVTVTHLLFGVSPALYVLFGVPVMRPDSVPEYLLFAAPYLGGILATLVVYGGARATLQLVQNMMFLAPVYALALVRAATGVRFFSGVTTKSGEPRFSTMLAVPVALLAVSLLAIAVAVRSSDRSELAVAAFWSAWTVFLLAGPVTAIGLPGVGLLRGAVRGWVPLPVLALVAVASLQPASGAGAGSSAGAAWPTPLATTGLAAAADDGGAPACGARRALPPRSGAYLGVYHEDLLGSERGVDRWAVARGAQPAIVHWYQPWRSEFGEFQHDWAQMVGAQAGGTVPLISWEPWEKPPESVHDPDQPAMRLERIVAGEFDDYIREWASAAADHRDPLLLRPMHEMNGWWYPWAAEVNGNTPELFVRAWRHLHAIFTEEGADNVSWVWAVNTLHGLEQAARDLAALYPGDEVVDWVSATGFNWGAGRPWSRWRDVERVLGETIGALADYDKPIMISELGTARVGGDQAAWVRETLRTIERELPQVRAVVWFDAEYPDLEGFRLTDAAAQALGETVSASSHWRSAPRTLRVNCDEQPGPRRARAGEEAAAAPAS